jgi:hypothetical protein
MAVPDVTRGHVSESLAQNLAWGKVIPFARYCYVGVRIQEWSNGETFPRIVMTLSTAEFYEKLLSKFDLLPDHAYWRSAFFSMRVSIWILLGEKDITHKRYRGECSARSVPQTLSKSHASFQENKCDILSRLPNSYIRHSTLASRTYL